MNDKTKETSRAVSRGKFLALIGIYAAPLLAAWLWLGYVRSNEGAGVSVNGELITPAVPLETFDLADADGQSRNLDSLRDKWSMLYFSEGECTEVCEKSLYNMRQVRLSTGRRMDRVQRVLVTPQVEAMSALLKDASEGLAVLGGTPEQIDSLRQQVVKAQDGMSECLDCVYLVDPFGNVMMRFASDLDPKKILKDLKHLLKVYRIG